MNLYILSSFNENGQKKIEEWIRSDNNSLSCNFFGEISLFKTQISNVYNQNAIGIIFSNGLNMLLNVENKIESIQKYLESVSEIIPNNFGNISPIRFIFVIEENLADIDKKQLSSMLIENDIYDIVHGNNINDLLYSINNPQTKIKAKVNNNLISLSQQSLEVQKAYESISHYPKVENLYVNNLKVEPSNNIVVNNKPQSTETNQSQAAVDVNSKTLDDIFNISSTVQENNVKPELEQVTSQSLEDLISKEEVKVQEKVIEEPKPKVIDKQSFEEQFKTEEVKAEVNPANDIVELTLEDIFTNLEEIDNDKKDSKVEVKEEVKKEQPKKKVEEVKKVEKKEEVVSKKPKKKEVVEKVKEEVIVPKKQQSETRVLDSYAPSFIDKVKKNKTNVNYVYGSKEINVDFLSFLKSFAIKNRTLLIFSNGVDLDTDLELAGFKYDNKKSLQNVFKKQSLESVKENVVGIDNIDILYPENNRNAFIKTIQKLVEDVRTSYDKIIVLLNYNNFEDTIKKDNIYILEPNEEILKLNRNKDVVKNAQRVFNDCGLMVSHIYLDKKDYL